MDNSKASILRRETAIKYNQFADNPKFNRTREDIMNATIDWFKRAYNKKKSSNYIYKSLKESKNYGKKI